MPGLERFQNHVVIPYLAADGHVTRLKFRSLDPEAVVRYGQPSGLALKMYNVQALTRAGDVIAITEGEFDALALESVGIPAVGLPGASSWKTHMGHLLDGFSRVVLCKDNDADDESKTDQLEAAIRRDFPDLPLVSIHPPRGLKDMNDMLTAGLDGDMRRLVMGR